jgi:hypothetical protein
VTVLGNQPSRSTTTIAWWRLLPGRPANVFVERNVAYQVRYGFYIRSNSHRGGVVENVYFNGPPIAAAAQF